MSTFNPGHLVTAVVAFFLLHTTPTFGQQQSQNEILQQRTEFLDFYRAGDAEGIVDQFHDKATFAGTLGPFWLVGKDAIRNLWTNYFNAWPARNLALRGQTGLASAPQVVFYNDETVSIETGYMLMYMGFGDNQKFDPDLPPVVTNIRYSITRVKTEGRWQIVNMNVARIPGQ